MSTMRSRKSRLWQGGLVVLAAMVFTAIYFAWIRSFPLEEEVDTRLRGRVGSRAASFHAEELVDFPWKRVCIVNPLASRRQVEELTGGKLPEDAKTGWFLDDSYWTLAYMTPSGSLVLIPVRVKLLADGTHGCRGPDAVFRIVYSEDNKQLPVPELIFD